MPEAALKAALKAAMSGLLAASFLAAPAAAVSRDAPETLRIRQRPSYAICAGVCPWYDISVGSGGAVVSRRLGLDRRDRIVARDIVRFRVSAARLAAFRRELAPLRPGRERQLDTACVQATREDGSPDSLDDPRPDDIAIDWTGGRHPAHFTACDGNRAVQDRLMRALRLVGLYQDGSRI